VDLPEEGLNLLEGGSLHAASSATTPTPRLDVEELGDVLQGVRDLVHGLFGIVDWAKPRTHVVHESATTEAASRRAALGLGLGLGDAASMARSQVAPKQHLVQVPEGRPEAATRQPGHGCIESGSADDADWAVLHHVDANRDRLAVEGCQR